MSAWHTGSIHQPGKPASARAVSKASRLTSLVSKASRFASLFESATKPGHALSDCWAGRLAYISGLVVLILLVPAIADPAPGTLKVPASGTSAPSTFVTVSQLGEPDQQAALRDGQLLSHRRATDPFGNAIRGPFKGLPPVVEHPTATPSQPNAATQVAATANVPTLDKAVQELVIGAVNVGTHEILVNSRSVREGDLLVLESGGRQFVVWVQSVGVRGVLFCDIDLQQHILKPLGSGPKRLTGDSVEELSDIRNFLNKDGQP